MDGDGPEVPGLAATGSGAQAPGHSFRLGGEVLIARPAGTLWWPARRLLCVGDLHLGRSERQARRGTLLPPYETTDTLNRLAHEIGALDPARVVCLGDSFDDGAAASALAPALAPRLVALAQGRDWVWLAGNHDPSPPAGLSGAAAQSLRIGTLTFRHIAGADAQDAEISGHYHPKARLTRMGRRLARPCFLLGAGRLILPAFGTYTGGMDACDPRFGALLGPGARAILTGPQPRILPLTALG